MNRLGDHTESDERWHDAIVEIVERLYIEHAVKLHVYLRFLGADEHTAKDIRQDTFEKIGRHLQKGHKLPADPIPFLFKTAKNAWIDELRRPHRTRIQLVDVHNDFHDRRADDPLKELIELDYLRNGPLSHLARREREVVALQDLCDLKAAQVAAILRIAVGSVGRYHSDAIKHLEELLALDGSDKEEGPAK
jgi:RNA polymerase sigma factor (sigma-70 family)